MSAIDRYSDHLMAAGRPQTTIRLRIWQLRCCQEEVGPLMGATTAELASYIGSKPWAPATKYSVRATLRDFYRFAVGADFIAKSPAETLPRVTVRKRNLPPAPEAAISAVSGDERTQLMVELAAREGLRRCEIAGIHARDVYRDDTEGWLLIVHGKGGRDRTIPLHPDLAARIRERAGRGWLFPSTADARGHLKPTRIGELISRALPDGWTAHSLRRAFATTTFQRSHDLRAVQMLLGHSSLATTQVYLGSGIGDMRAAMIA